MGNSKTQWGDMANNFANVWADTGTQMWKNWIDLMGSMPVVNPIANPVTDTKPEFKYFTQRFADNQELFARFFKLSFNAWTEIFPKVEAGENWQQSLNKYTDQMRKQLDDFFTGTLKVSQDAGQLWQLYLQETQKLNQLWSSALTSTLSPMSKTVTGGSESWIELNNLYWNLLYEETFGSLMQSPILGPTRELNGKMLRAFDAWTNLYRATTDFQVVLANIQVRSFEALMRELVSMAEKGEKVEDWRQFQQIWGRVADEVFAEAFCSEDNLRVRGKFLNALNTYRLYQNELMDLWMKMMNIPSRSEVDEMHKNVYELRKEVKTLKKALAKYEALDSKVSKSPIKGAVETQKSGISEAEESKNSAVQESKDIAVQEPKDSTAQEPKSYRKPKSNPDKPF